jgi:hypothetical protein
MSPEQMLAMLRHAYEQIVHDAMGDPRRFADGLIAPVIRGLETHVMFAAISDPKNAHLFTVDAALEAFDAQPLLTKEKAERTALTKADTRALWHAVNNADFMLRELVKDPRSTSPATVQAEKDLVAQAKRALRKVNALRKEGL